VKFLSMMSFVNPEFYIELAQLAEQCSWDGFGLSDHVVNPDVIEAKYPYNEDGSRMWDHSAPWPDVWVSTAAMAAVTTKLEVIQSVYVLPMRDPFTVAKALGTCALMSNYRVSLGLGLGWMHDEFEILGHPFKGRGKRADEMVEVMQKLWTGELVEHHGKYIDFEPLTMSPGMKGDIPIVVGGISKPAMDRVARLGDGWAPAYLTVEGVREGLAYIREKQKEYGREGKPLTVYTSCTDAFNLDGYKRMEDAGVTHAITTPWLFGKEAIDYKQIAKGAPLDKLRAGIESFAHAVIAKL
jgi:probable F420-dependent oxidoreductase